jgi:hypothetical protein
VAKHKFDLFEISPIFSAELCVGPAKIVRPEALDPDLLADRSTIDQMALHPVKD